MVQSQMGKDCANLWSEEKFQLLIKCILESQILIITQKQYL